MQKPSSISGDRIDLKAVNGRLLYFTVYELVKDIQTNFGPSDAVRCDVAILDGDEKGTVYNDTLIFPSVLRRQLAGAVGNFDSSVLGRLTQGTAKAGQSAPWMLAEPTPADIAIGEKYEAYAAKQKADQEEPF